MPFEKSDLLLRCNRAGVYAISLLLLAVGASDTACAQAANEAPASPVPAVTAAADLPRDLSPWGMYLTADPLVKGVLIALVLASVITWTVWLAKSIELFAAKRRARKALAQLAAARSIADANAQLGQSRSVSGRMVQAAVAELRLSDDSMEREGIKERVASRLQRIEANGGRAIMRGTGILATIGAIAPFVGLFGTVWGIMNSFIGISKAQTTNLAVVAPGIAEALLATAIGLVAAIPAVIIYNHFARVTKTYLELVSRASGAAGRLLSRDLDRTHGGANSRAAE